MSEKKTKAELKNVSIGKIEPALAEQVPDEVLQFLQSSQSVSPDTPLSRDTLEKIFADSPHIATSLLNEGTAEIRNSQGVTVVLGAGFNTNGDMITTAAAIPRTPGKSENFLKEVEDFSTNLTGRKELLDLYDTVYRREGVVNNAINKSAALVGTEGKFKVRYVKGKKGISGDKRAEELSIILQFWQENVNGRGPDGAVTGDRGLTAFISQGTRLALKQGDHFGRQNWDNVDIPILKKTFSLPISLQSFDARTIEIPEGLEGTGIDLFYWVPPSNFIDTLKEPQDENVKEHIDKLIPPEVQSGLIADGKWLLDPALMIHVKHRGTATANYGESMIEPAMTEIAYKRALQALDMVTIENLINRLVIIMIGSDDKESVYHKQEVSGTRMSMMSNMLRKVGPAATIIWPGPDIEIKEVGAHNAILEMDERYKQAEIRIRNALGVPSALLSGDSGDGKAAGWAAIVGLAAELTELRNQYKQIFRTIAERIALDNGYEDVDVVWEFSQELLTNKEQHVSMIMDAFKGGALSFQTVLEELGFDFDAEQVRMIEDVALGRREELFGPPRAFEQPDPMGGESPEGEDGRPPGGDTVDPRKDKETQKTTENK